MHLIKQTRNIDAIILNSLNIIIHRYVVKQSYTYENKHDLLILSLLDVARIIMDKLTGIFPSENYSKESVYFYLALRRAYRVQIKRKSLRKAIERLLAD